MSYNKKIENAVILTGPGRSGTTLLSNWLALHPELAWISNYVNFYPRFPQLSFFNRVQQIEWLENWTRKQKKWPRPYEAYNFWHYFFKNFNAELPESDQDNIHTESCKKALVSICKWQGASRLFTKVTGFSRWNIFDQIFEKPKVIWMERDPRAVVLSMLQNQWYFRSKSEIFSKMTFSEKANFYTERYKQMRTSRLEYPQDNFFEIRYKDLVSNKKLLLTEIAGFVNLSMDEKWIRQIDSWPIVPVVSDNYKKKIEPDNWKLISELLRSELEELKYEI